MDEQLSLFDDRITKEAFAQRIVDELNRLDTCWKGNFYVDKIHLGFWDHVQLKEKVLEITIKAKNWAKDRTFIYFTGDTKSQMNLCGCGDESPYLVKLFKDKDFAFSPTPWNVYIFYHNWEKKRL